AWRGDYAAMDAEGAAASGFRRFREGFLSNVTNPKVLALYLSVLPQFLDPVRSTPFDALLLAYTVAVLGALWLVLLLVFVHRDRRGAATPPRWTPKVPRRAASAGSARDSCPTSPTRRCSRCTCRCCPSSSTRCAAPRSTRCCSPTPSPCWARCGWCCCWCSCT